MVLLPALLMKCCESAGSAEDVSTGALMGDGGWIVDG